MSITREELRKELAEQDKRNHEIFATKEDLGAGLLGLHEELRGELTGLGNELRSEMQGMETRIQTQFETVSKEINNSHDSIVSKLEFLVEQAHHEKIEREQAPVDPDRPRSERLFPELDRVERGVGDLAVEDALEIEVDLAAE